MSRSLRYLALGDSWCTGEGTSTATAWPTRLTGLLRERGLDIAEPHYVAGRPWGSRELMGNLALRFPDPPDTDDEKFDLVTLQVGYHDILNGLSADEFVEPFAAAINFCRLFGKDLGWRLIVFTMPDWSDTEAARAIGPPAQVQECIDEYNLIMAVAAQMALYPHLVDLAADSIRNPYRGSAICADGVHPSITTHQRWAELALHSAEHALTHPVPPLPTEEELAEMERMLQSSGNN